MHHLRLFLILCITSALAITTARADEAATISAAISLKDALTDAARQFKTAGGGDVQFNFAASGELMAQIKNGAPVDAFISAASKQIDDLARAGSIDPATRRIIAGNSLVLIVPAGAKSAPPDFKALADPKYAKIATGEPRTVPAGAYAAQVFKALGIEAAMSGRLVYGTHVRQVLTYVERGEVDAGIVYGTDAKISGDKVRVLATADAAWHEPIVYPAVMLKGAAHAPAAKAFLDYLAGEKGQTILVGYGFTPAASAATQPAAPAVPAK